MDMKLGVIMASLMPFDTLVKKLQEEIDQYNENSSQENKDSVAAVASMVLMNHMANGSIDGAIKLSDRFGKMDRLEQLFETGDN